MDAFETFLASDYAGEGEDGSIVACGPMVPDAMRAAWVPKKGSTVWKRALSTCTR